ncbi:hypothetical protein RhiirA4_488162 [Rhizophagus irregularis]|uniref:Uncharacterized protein n=1 Tax=Rhizophagus irregularis TaxID=588596 RepID=A0A2I1HTE1_9GLOM|nr:hypothetical protein RhiirA4_488162 [Rhizophagus irregularis]
MIQYKINLTKEELEKYLKGEEKIELDICDENDEIIEKKVISKNMKNKVVIRKRKRNNEEIEEERQEMRKLRKENKVERFRNELELPIKDNKEILLEESARMTQNKEIEDVKRLVEKYLDLGDANSGIIQKYYYLGQGFERKVVEKKNQADQTIRKELYDEMMKFLKNQIIKDFKKNVIGENPKEWTDQVEKYLLKIGIKDDKRIFEITKTHLLGKALQWFENEGMCIAD